MTDFNSYPPFELDARALCFARSDATATDVPAPWTILELEACFVVLDSGGQKVAFIYYAVEPERPLAVKLPSKDEARRIAANVAKLPELLHK